MWMHIEHCNKKYTDINVGDSFGKTEAEARDKFAEIANSGTEFINLDDTRGRKYTFNKNDISGVEFGYKREPKKK